MNTTSSNASTYTFIFRSESYVLTWISALISTIFSYLSLRRYFRSKIQRTHLTYVYHFSLGFALILSLISTPLYTLTEYFWSILPLRNVPYRRLLCHFNLITVFIASSGIGYSIGYASLEQTIFIFYSKPIRLTWIRQFTPFLIIFSLCSIIMTIVVLLFKCSYETSSCLKCYFDSLTFHFIWFLFQFIIPFLLMLIAVIFLLYHIEIHLNRIRISLNRKRSRNKFQRILIHFNLYNIYYLVSICPLHFYLFIRIHFDIKPSIIEIILINYFIISLHCYSILIYLLAEVKQKHQRIIYHQEQRQSPYIIITHPSIQFDVYERTRL